VWLEHERASSAAEREAYVKEQTAIGEELEDGAQPAFHHFDPTPAQAAVLALVRHSFLRRGDFRRQLVRLCDWLRPGPIDTEFRQGRFRLHYQDSLAESGMLCASDYNRAELIFLLEGTPRGGIFVDLGANVGLYSIPLALQVGPAGRVIAVEPGEEALKRLRFNIAANGLANVSVFPFAVGDADYRADLRPLRGGHQPRGQDADIGLSQVVPAASGSVRVRPLKDMLEEAGVMRMDTLKVDVETFEDRVVPPFFDTTAQSLWPQRICLEPTTYYHRAPIHRFLEDRGYREVGRTRKNSLWQRG
jgi:FkbM family methyltransferase